MVGFRKPLAVTVILCFIVTLSPLLVHGAQASSTTKVGIITGSIVNLRSTPSTSGKVLEKLPKGTQVNVISSSGNWYKVEYDNLTGYVIDDYITVKTATTTVGTVTTQVLNMRSKPELTADIVTKLSEGERVVILTRSGDWYKVKNSEGTVGWVSGDYLSVKSSASSRGDISREDIDEDETPSSGSDEASTTAQEIISYAKKFLGVRYVYGGNSPSEGFDCSGFTKYVFGHFGISLERTAADQATQGVKVSRGNLRPGDLVFFDTNGGHNHINHVGIYIGDGKFIHASSPRYDVTITYLSEAYYSNSYMRSRRIL